MSERELEPAGQNDYGPCECCGGVSRSVWGYLHQGERTEAAYFVHWTLGHVKDHGAHFDLVLGRWDEGAGQADRYSVSLEFRRTERGPEFMVIDSETQPVAKGDLAGKALARHEVIGTPLARQVFDIVDDIWFQDERIRELTEPVR